MTKQGRSAGKLGLFVSEGAASPGRCNHVRRGRYRNEPICRWSPRGEKASASRNTTPAGAGD